MLFGDLKDEAEGKDLNIIIITGKSYKFRTTKTPKHGMFQNVFEVLMGSEKDVTNKKEHHLIFEWKMDEV